jgi:uncharacterized protein YcbK (DUF882 family)
VSGRFARKFPVPPRLARAGKTTATCLGIAAFLLVLGSRSLQTAVAEGDTRTLSFHHVHTGEDLTVTFKRNGRYDQAALEKLDWFMRDWRKSEETKMDPQLFDLLWETYREVGATEPIQIICGYRSPSTNAMLRARSSGVAQASLHTKGDAIDFFIPGVPLEKIRNAGLRLQRGGVGFYPTSGSPFVHLDVGSIRHWPRMTHDQLVKVFPNGRTVHIPTDGQPLAGYALALADVEKKGHAPSAMSLASARDAGVISEDDEEAAERTTVASKTGVSIAAPAKVATVAIIPMPKQRPGKQIAVAALVPTPKSRPGSAPVDIAAADPVATATTGQALAYAPEAVTPDVSRPVPMGMIASADAQTSLPKSDQLAVLHPTARIDNPWMRATIMAPNLREFLTTTPTGRLDTRQVREFMQKPRTPVVMMSFSADPQNGLRADMFSGQAVVFLATLPSTMRTASLAR